MKDSLPPTELKSNVHEDIDKVDDNTKFSLLIQTNEKAVRSVENSKNSIKEAIHKILDKVNNTNSSRIIYCGAGTSARVGVQDGSELYPTFGWPINRVDYIIAGGTNALIKSIENAEDDIDDAKLQVGAKNINKNDVVIGLTASGNTPFTCEVIKEAKKRGALTIGISNNSNGNINKISELPILLDTGPETVVGSTRLKAGTAQKICLNIISTILMIKLGRVERGMMNFLVPTNKKLKKRKALINYILKS